MISITKINAELDSAIVFDENPRSQIRRHSSRVSITPTLDGGGVLDNQGYSVADRILTIRAILDQSRSAKLWQLFKDELYINIGTNDGVFFGSIENIELDNGQLFMTILIKE